MALKAALISPNEPDRDGDPTNELTAAVQKATGAHNENDRG